MTIILYKQILSLAASVINTLGEEAGSAVYLSSLMSAVSALLL